MLNITLTSDLGHQDHYLSILKRQVRSLFPSALLEDITHEVPPHHLLNAAFVVKRSFPYFQEKSLHVIALEDLDLPDAPLVLVKFKHHYFLAKNNGILSLVLGDKAEFCYEIKEASPHSFFPFLNPYVQALELIKQANVLESLPVSSFGKSVEMLQKSHLHPNVQKGLIRGSVVYNDAKGNAYTNIHFKSFGLFEDMFNSYKIFYNRQDYFDAVIHEMSELEMGEPYAAFDENGHLVIGIFGGNAKQLLSLEYGSMILVQFFEDE